MRAWKKSEFDIPEILGPGWRRLVKRHYGDSRADVGHYDLSKGDPDPRAEPNGKWSFLKLDSKTFKRFSFHRLIEKIFIKYCAFHGGAEPVLITREKGVKPPMFIVSIPLELFATLLAEIEAWEATMREENERRKGPYSLEERKKKDN